MNEKKVAWNTDAGAEMRRRHEHARDEAVKALTNERSSWLMRPKFTSAGEIAVVAVQVSAAGGDGKFSAAMQEAIENDCICLAGAREDFEALFDGAPGVLEDLHAVNAGSPVVLTVLGEEVVFWSPQGHLVGPGGDA